MYSGSPDNSSTGASFWIYGRTAMDCTHMLKKYMYQLASRSARTLQFANFTIKSGEKENVFLL
jgi:hypothetical protein